MERPYVLVVDDDFELLESATDLLSMKYNVATASTIERAKRLIARTSFEVVIVDLNFEGQDDDGIALLDHIFAASPDSEVIVLSGDKVTSRIVAAMKRNLAEFVPKEGDYESALNLAILKALEKRRIRVAQTSKVEFLTDSPKMRDLLQVTKKIAMAPGQFSILIQGETGTGKEVLAKYFAALTHKKIVAANMASISRETAESELFGHMKGSFTGAHANRIGLIEQATRGLFFLDELGECSLSVQAKLLRVVQEREVVPVGANVPRKVDVRFISATHRNLNAMVESGEFREDLLQRLNAFVLRIPPLRERPEDIVLYATRFIAELDYGRKLSLEASAMAALLDYDWPGNVRQLRNIIERVSLLSPSADIDGRAVKAALGVVQSEQAAPVIAEPLRDRVLAALEEESGNRAKASARLGVHPTTLRRWLKKHGISGVHKAVPGRRAWSGRPTNSESEEVS